MANAIYNLLFKRTSTVVVVIIASSFVFERSVNLFSDRMFEHINKGVRINVCKNYCKIF